MRGGVLDQAEVWVNSRGVHRLDAMDPDHRANLIPFLRGNARTLFALYNGVHPEAVTGHQAEEWLQQTPLMRRLCELEAGRPIEDRQATHERNQRYEAETGYQKVRHG